MLNLFRRTQQWSVYPLISGFLGAWLIVTPQFCAASIEAELASAEHDSITSPCDLPVTNDHAGQACCDDASPCGAMELMADTSILLPMVYERASFDLSVIAYTLPEQLTVPYTSLLCSLYQDPERANVLPIERFCVQLK